MTTYYCSSGDVATILGVDAFSDTTKPTATQVDSMINMVEDEIDRYTGHAWREKVSDVEYREVGRIGWRHPIYYWLGYPIYLGHRKVRVTSGKLDSTLGDIFEVYFSGTWTDWLDGTHDDDYWVDDYRGIIYIKQGLWGYRYRWSRIQYRYGDTSVPNDIKMACSLLSARQILMSQDRWMLIPEGGTGSVVARDKIQSWTDRAYGILDRYMEYLQV